MSEPVQNNPQCFYHGHVWGNGPTPGLLVCCRQRCTARAACPVCLSGGIPHGLLVASCQKHTPAPAPLLKDRKRRLVRGASFQSSLWEKKG